MFASWFKETQSALQRQNDLDTIVNEVLKAVRKRLSEEIGEQIPEQAINQIKQEISSSRRLQEQLIDTKAKYHDLVEKLTLYQNNAKKIALCVTGFVHQINQQLKSQELMIPMNQIEKGISDMSVDKVQKHINFLTKIYESSFDDMLQEIVKAKQTEFMDQMQLLKNLHKNLESELLNSRTAKSQFQKKNIELSIRLTEIADKNCFLESNAKQESLQNDLKERFKTKENELAEQIKLLEKQKGRIQQKLVQAQNQVIKSGTIVEKIKVKDEELMDDQKKVMKRKQAMYEISMKKVQGEKVHLHDLIQTLKQELETQRNQKTALSQQNNRQKTQALNSGKVAQLQEKISSLENSKKQLQVEIEQLVGKQIVRELFVSYDDESKQWSIRKDIRRQLHGLLGVQQKAKQNLNEEGPNKKWFGIF